MKKIYKYCVIIFTSFSFIACNQFLDVKPKGYTILENFKDYVELMEYAQMFKAGDSYPAFLTDDVLLASGNINANFTESQDHIKNLYSFAHGNIFSYNENDPYWNFTYSRIYTCNVVINGVMTSRGGNEQAKLTLQAEAKVARAFEFLSLMSLYAPAYDHAKANTDWGIPLNYSEDVSLVKYERNTVEQVYQAIVKDLQEALPYLKENAEHRFKPSKSVAYGFLARMYLMQMKYDLALENAAKALTVSKELIDMKEYMVLPDKSSGRIVKKNDKLVSYPVGQMSPENIYARFEPYVFGNSEKVYASEDLLAIYSKDLPPKAIDKRLELWYSKNSFLKMQFEGYTMFVPYVYSNQGLTNQDVILIAAEGYARRGGAKDLEEAAKLYNLLRDNRIENNTHVVFTDKDNALLKVLEERRREFAMVGTYRLVDLKRLNKEAKFAKTISHTADGKTWTLPPNDNRYIMPIPPVVKGFRPDLPDYQR